MSAHAQTPELANSGITPTGRRRIILIAIVSGVLAFLSFFIPNAEERNMRAAQRHIEVIAPRVYADSRFHQVHLQPYYALDGSLGVLGSVASASDLADLKRIIDESQPPVKVFYQVFTDEQFKDFDQQAK
jgi:hypothetical protein